MMSAQALISIKAPGKERPGVNAPEKLTPGKTTPALLLPADAAQNCCQKGHIHTSAASRAHGLYPQGTP